MPTTNKRVNLTISDTLYERIQAYKTKNGISSDAGACLQLITRQLDGLEKTEQMLDMVSRFKPEELLQISALGLTEIKNLADARNSSMDGNT